MPLCAQADRGVEQDMSASARSKLTLVCYGMELSGPGASDPLQELKE